MGNYFLFTSSTCEITAPPLFGMSLAMIILGYFMVAIPVLLCIAAVFCLPCALIVLRTFRIGPDGGSGAKPDEIKSVALLKYRYGSSTQPPNTSAQMTSVTSVPLPHKPSFLSKLRSKLSQEKKPCLDEFIDMREISNLPEFRVANTEDALCVICLEEYRDGELIRKPRCNHHFHRQCLDEWLLINKYCPLCKADVFPTSNDSP
ncbi:hypothetical protein K7432_015630 [Basidiobolus ranarum]|uniref:RING-type domain-containing protein n=1 Tax=Basidiobolus ranarum TaxID=34480 RepID=A0ABR2WFW1_9FUNG